MLQIQSKRFYLDVKQNKRGKFIKVEKRLCLLASSAYKFQLNTHKSIDKEEFIKEEKDSLCMPAVLGTDSDSAQGLNSILRWLRSALMDDGLKSSWRYPLQVDKLET